MVSVAVTEISLTERLRSGDETAFEELVTTYHRHLLPLARFYCGSTEAAEDVIQETWLAVLKGIDRFEERATLKTWLSRIVMNRARTAGVRRKRFVSFNDLAREESPARMPAVDPARFHHNGPWQGHWSDSPEHQALSEEAIRIVHAVVETLPEAQRLVITLRDIQGWSADEVCNVLEVSETNQRVLLHRARSRVRDRLERYLRRTDTSNETSGAELHAIR